MVGGSIEESLRGEEMDRQGGEKEGGERNTSG